LYRRSDECDNYIQWCSVVRTMYSWLIIRCVVGEQINLLSPQYNKPILGVHRNRDNYIRICIFKEYLKLLNRFMKSVGWPKPGYTSITCSIISNIPYNLIFTTRFNDSSILIPNISCNYLNLSWADLTKRKENVLDSIFFLMYPNFSGWYKK
jgi:hypothetical protein